MFVFLSVSNTTHTSTALLPIWMAFAWCTGRHAERLSVIISYFGGPGFDSGNWSLSALKSVTTGSFLVLYNLSSTVILQLGAL